MLALVGLQQYAWATDVYTIDMNSSKSRFNNSHVMNLLKAALEASSSRYGAYELKVSSLHMERERLLQEMLKGDSVNLSGQVTSAEWESRLIPIRIPLDKGLSCYRISLIDGRKQNLFSAVQTLDQLKQYSVGTGRQWSSSSIYRHAGLPLVESNSTLGLHNMLAAGRFQYFPRAIDEAFYEQAAHVQEFPALAVERSFALYIPAPRYFFIGGQQQRLAQRLEYGLQRLIADGRYEQLFHQFYDGLIEQAGLRKRRIFRLDNPELSPLTPLQVKAYWYVPD
ncbi:hypothetical protein GTP27_20740 [Pseudoduganella sp. CY13W]|uniref:Transporter substrate-binding domain-containing protein n=2 Tax=Duganella qianjiadongensis TaxID=2692176 RepID=A0ABW9VSC3_9BURK|nr:hypothetical protein [Duganella qianjiadongensis]MYM41738.1 hypothetical protein [Duganella qianjiadongensis]